MDSIYLQGSEDVRSAASTIRTAATEMNQVASNISSIFSQHERFLDDWLVRFQDMLDTKLKEKEDGN